MANTGLEQFDETLQLTHEWLNDVSDQLGFQDRRDAYSSLRAVLQALRDRLTFEEAVHLGDQLPMLIRGFYYEGWKPGENPGRERTAEEFLSNIQRNLRFDLRRDAEQIAHAVFQVIAKRITQGEVDDVVHQLPAAIVRVLR
jgi:uncharacterized protein (DUF2267 family)